MRRTGLVFLLILLTRSQPLQADCGAPFRVEVRLRTPGTILWHTEKFYVKAYTLSEDTITLTDVYEDNQYKVKIVDSVSHRVKPEQNDLIKRIEVYDSCKALVFSSK